MKKALFLFFTLLTISGFSQSDSLLYDVLTYEAGVQNQSVVVSWTYPCWEGKISYFIVERSRDKQKTSEIERQESFCEFPGTPSQYAVWDRVPLEGVTYYRIKARSNVAERWFYTDWKTIVFTQNGQPYRNIYPNPFTRSEGVTVEWENISFAPVHITLTSMDGAQKYTLVNADFPPGLHSTQYLSHGASQGLYYLQIKIGDTITTQRVFVQ